jgi:glycerol uptake facilitator-like aquaporin
MDTKKYAAETIGTFWLTFAGCGSAVIAAGFPQVGIGGVLGGVIYRWLSEQPAGIVEGRKAA